MGERGQRKMKKTQNHWDFIFRARRLFFLYTIRNNYSRRRRQTHPFLKVFIIKSSWDQWFQLAVDNHTQQQRGLHLGYLRPQSDRCLCFNFILRDPLPRSWTCCCSWGGREGKRYKWWSLNCWETMQTPSSVFSAPTPGSNWVWRWTGRLSSEGVWGRAWAGWEQEVYRHSKSQNLFSELQSSMALLGAYPYSTVMPQGTCMWDWHTDCIQSVRVHSVCRLTGLSDNIHMLNVWRKSL